MRSPLVSIFLKAPRPGRVKTRIAQSLGPDIACTIYRELVGHVLHHLQELPDVELRFTPEDPQAAAEIHPWLRPGWIALGQGPGDLGQRMAHAIRHGLQRQYPAVIVIGSDCPDVQASDIQSAAHALSSGADVVLGPAEDGGYWLIATNADHPSLFDGIEWSTERVLQQTLEVAAKANLAVHQLRTLRDIDTARDWEVYQSQSSANAR